jgi:ABC-type Mn2+/Zn2+ transport system ATPase subunit
MPFLPYGNLRRTARIDHVPALDAQKVSAQYAGATALALHEVNLCVQPGARVALVGPNGSGKSTLLKVAAGLLPPSTGHMLIYGLPVNMAHHLVAYLPQRGELDWTFPISVRKLVLTGRYVYLGWLKRPKPHDWQIADAALEHMGLSDLAERQISELSGGQQQRTLLARALAQNADLLLLDEPLNAVDAKTKQIVARVLADLKTQGKTAIIATHDIDHLDTDFDGAVYLADGKQVHMDAPCFDDRGIHHAHSIMRPAGS